MKKEMKLVKSIKTSWYQLGVNKKKKKHKLI